MARNKCVCDICGKTIYMDADDKPKRVIKYWSGIVGKLENNRKIQTEKCDLCSIDCCLSFMNRQDTNLSNPFSEYYFEVVPIKVMGVTEEV